MKTSTNNQARGEKEILFPPQRSQKWLRLLGRGMTVSCCMGLIAATKANAASFSFDKIADTRSDFANVFSGAAINDHGTVAFLTSSNSTPSNVYTGDGTTITEIFNSNQLPSLFDSTVSSSLLFYSLSSPIEINNNGSIAFNASQSDISSSTLNKLVLAQGDNLTIRGTGNTFLRSSNLNLLLQPDLNNQDQLAYLRQNTQVFDFPTTYSVVLTSANQPDITIASASGGPNYPPFPNERFRSIEAASLNNLGEVIFAATENSGTVDIVSSKDDLLTTNGNTKVSGLAVNDNGNVILSSGDAIRLFNRASSELTTIADTSNSLKSFSAPTLNNNGNVAFTATLNTGEKGIFTGADPVADKVIATGDSLFNSTVTNLSFLQSGFNNNGQIAFYAQLADGTSGIYRANPGAETPPPQPLPPAEDSFVLSKIVDTNTQLPDGAGNISFFSNPVIDGNTAVFGLNTGFSGQQQGIYKSSDGIISTIANQNTSIPNGVGTFFTLGAPVINGGSIVFKGLGLGTQQGIYIQRGENPLSVIVDTNTLIPGSSRNFATFFNYQLLNAFDVAFIGANANQQGIYINRNGALQVVADTNTPIPSGQGNFSNFSSYQTLDENNLAFLGAGANQQGIYLSQDGTLQVVADTNTPIPNGIGNFGSFGSYQLLDKNNIAFLGENGTEQRFKPGIYLSHDGNLQVVADTNTPIPNGIGNFISFSYPTNASTPSNFFSQDSIVFKGFGNNNQQGIYLSRDGSLQVLADTNTPIPGSTNKFTSFDNLFYNGDIVAFLGNVNNQALGVYAYVDGSVVKVADLSSKLDGKRISTLFNNLSISDGNSLILSAILTDGTSAYFRADLNTNKSPQSVPEGASILGLAALAVFSLKYSQRCC